MGLVASHHIIFNYGVRRTLIDQPNISFYIYMSFSHCSFELSVPNDEGFIQQKCLKIKWFFNPR